MAGYELLSDQGLRLDGRRSGELRRIRCRVGVFGQADGSAYFEQVKNKWNLLLSLLTLFTTYLNKISVIGSTIKCVDFQHRSIYQC